MSTAASTDVSTDVKILIAPEPGSPGLPADVATTLFSVIGMAYPNARMGSGLPGLNGWTLILSEDDRVPRTKVGKRAAAKAFQPRTSPEDDAAAVRGFDGKDMTFALPEEVSRNLAGMALLFLDATEGATNYVELKVSHPDIGDAVVIAARSTGQTPDALRRKADTERDALAQKIQNLIDQVDIASPQGGTVHVDDLRALIATTTRDGATRG